MLAVQLLGCLDLTSLNPGDTEPVIERLCARAVGPAGPTAAVCVWPRWVGLARSCLPAEVAVAAVANFPEGRLDLEPVLREAGQIADAGAQEIDVVLPWRALMAGQMSACAIWLRAVRRATGSLRLKLIIESGELNSPELITQASALGLGEGVDFLKTSTGKTAVGATPQAAQLMLQTIAQDHAASGRVGFKASGGVRTVAEAAVYAELVERLLGHTALGPARFRVGASALLDDIEAIWASAGGSPT